MDLLAEVSFRSLFLFLVATAVMCLLRVKSASTRHAVLTSVTAGMLLLVLLNPLLPPMPLRILKAEIPAIVFDERIVETPMPVAPHVEAVQSAGEWESSWSDILSGLYVTIAAAYLLRLLVGYILTQRLVARAIPATAEFLESADIATPVTVGWIRPKILLPTTWRTWEEPKLRAVLAHEQAHIARADWPIAALAGVNRSLFWFHPLAWWLERRLSTLAEQACDDSALLALGNREQYAQTLLDMAAAQRGLLWRAIPMAGRASVARRIDRILDEARIIPAGLSRMRHAVIALCSVPILCVIAGLQLAPPEAMGQGTGLLAEGNQLTYAEMTEFENELTSNPQNLAARGKLIAHYYQQGVREPRLTHIWWLIEHRPESELTGFAAAGISPRPSSLNTSTDYERTRALWKRVIARFPKDTLILSNAVQFFSQPGGDAEEAERLIKRGRAIEPRNRAWTRRLGTLYTSVLASGANLAMTKRVKTELEQSWDRPLLLDVHTRIASIERRVPHLGELARSLRAAHHLGGFRIEMHATYDQEPPAIGPRPNPTLRRIRMVTGLSDASIDRRVAPVYPELARQHRIEGAVHFRVIFGHDGHVRELQLLDGHPLLVASARVAVSQWIHKPLAIRGESIEVESDVEILFELPEPAA